MRTWLTVIVVMAGILAQAAGQSTVRYDNTTKAVIAPIPFRVGQSATDPTTPGNGSIWYDTVNNTLDARINGATVNLGAGGGSITGADTRVLFFDGANTPAGDGGLAYNKTTDTLSAGDLAVASGSVTLAGFTLTAPGAGGTLVTTGTLAGGGLTGALTTLSLAGALTLPDNVRQTFNPGATVSGFNLGSQAGDPSTPTNGDVWYDSTANTLDARINGVTVNLGAASAGDVVGPASATDNAVARFDSTTGKLLQNSAATLSDAGALSVESVAADTISGAGVLTSLSLGGNSFTIGGPTSITGGGTLALAGFTLTVPGAGGTIVTTATLASGALPGALTTLSASGLATVTAGLKMGADGAPPVTPQVISAGNASSGTGATVQISAGTGITAGGSLVLRTAATGTLADRLTITAAGGATFSGNLTTSGSFTFGNNNLSGGSSGIVTLWNSAGTDLNRLQLGGTTSGFPALKRSTTSIAVRLADDSADAPLTASNLTASGFLAVGVQSLSGAGAVNVTTGTTKLTTTGIADALTLADGVNGQVKTIAYAAEGGGTDSAVLTPATKTGFSTITFGAIGNAVILQFFTTQGWMITSSYGATVTP